jgi:hypothetical protein
MRLGNVHKFSDSNGPPYFIGFCMPEFSWEPLDFLDALGVIPIEEEDGISYSYQVDRSPLTVSLMIWPLAGDVELAVRCAGVSTPIVLLNLLNSPGARVVSAKDGKFIEFAAANMFSGRYDNTRPAPYGFRLWVEPELKVTTFSYDV